MSTWLGSMLRGVRAGERRLLWNTAELASTGPDLHLESPAFEAGAVLPRRFAGKGVGQNIAPPLRWSAVPAQTQELVLVLEDPDAPLPTPFLHLLLFGVAPACSAFSEGVLPGRLGANTFRQCAYAGPRALPGHGPHGYVFQLFALGRALEVGAVHTRRDLLKAAAGSVLARGRLEVFFERI